MSDDPGVVLRGGIQESRYTGVAAEVQRDGHLVHTAVVGDAIHTPQERAVPATDTLFDLASVTKVMGTTAALMALCTAGMCDVDDPLARYDESPHPHITLRQLLTHRSGLAEWQPLYLASGDRTSTVHLVSTMPLRYRPGAERHYSDLGMILLGSVVEQVCGMSLSSAVADLVTGPLSLDHTMFGPVAPERAAAGSDGDGIEREMIRTGEPYPVSLVATREVPWRSGTIRGQVNDGNAFHAMQGVSGHAGLFSTLKDLVPFGLALLTETALASADVLSSFLTPGADNQALGFWCRDLVDGPAFWHSGFTGTRLLVSPSQRLVAVLLTNRLHAMAPSDYAVPDLEPTWEHYLTATGCVRHQ